MKVSKEQKRLRELYRITGKLFAEAQSLATHIAAVQSEIWELMRDRNAEAKRGEQMELEKGGEE